MERGRKANMVEWSIHPCFLVLTYKLWNTGSIASCLMFEPDPVEECFGHEGRMWFTSHTSLTSRSVSAHIPFIPLNFYYI